MRALSSRSTSVAVSSLFVVVTALGAGCDHGPLASTHGDPLNPFQPLPIGGEGEGEGAAGEGEGEGEGVAGEGEGEGVAGEGEGEGVAGEGEGEGPAPCTGNGCGSSTPAGSLASPRAWHGAVLLADGRVAITGGYANVRLASSELNAGSGFVAAPTLFAPRSGHASVAVSAGVLVIGGAGDDPNTGDLVSLNTAELISVDSGVRLALPHLDRGRSNCSATVLQDGRILVAGGNDDAGVHGNAVVLSADLSSWTQPIQIGSTHASHASVLLADGRVLVAGGQADFSGASSAAASVFDPNTTSFSNVGSMSAGRQGLAAVKLQDGRVLVAGGWSDAVTGVESTAEIFDPATNAWSRAADLPDVRSYAIAVLLGDGRAALFGGFDSSNVTTTPLLYDAATDSWATGAVLSFPRYGHTATALPDGSVLIVGGTDGNLAPEAVAERWAP